MPIIDKWSCMAACVSIYKDCPFHDTMHKVDDYPLYYDALYFPELHLATLETLETVRAWLSAGVEKHEINCQYTLNNNGKFSVGITDDCFQISLEGHESLITAEFVASASFTFCCMARMCANCTLNRNLAWVMYSEEHYKEDFM